MYDDRVIVGHGLDVVDIRVFEKLLGERGFERRCFSVAELELANASGQRVVFLAARFAAKEAVMKALGSGWRDGLSWHEIEILRAATGAPLVTMVGGTKALADSLGVARVLVTISHTEFLAVASAIAAM